VENGWYLFDDAWIRQELALMSKARYENEVAFLVTKVLLRE
jgi:hypothetical protein